mmetsp:Transcript_27759/g.89279  ORF Transcript_27759/g.89279 Transcript_27759/m.89279 type:complete len:229 (-) Transcript_27759:30-716(-)
MAQDAAPRPPRRQNALVGLQVPVRVQLMHAQPVVAVLHRLAVVGLSVFHAALAGAQEGQQRGAVRAHTPGREVGEAGHQLSEACSFLRRHLGQRQGIIVVLRVPRRRRLPEDVRTQGAVLVAAVGARPGGLGAVALRVVCTIGPVLGALLAAAVHESAAAFVLVGAGALQNGPRGFYQKPDQKELGHCDRRQTRCRKQLAPLDQAFQHHERHPYKSSTAKRGFRLNAA